MTAISTPGPARRRTLTPYVLLWLLMAGLSLAYLTFLGVRPDLVAAWRSSGPDPQKEIAETKQSVERAIADLDPVRRSVGEMKVDVANLKIGAQEATERDKILLEKVQALEQASSKERTAQAGKAPTTAAASPTSPAAGKSAKVAPLAADAPPAPAASKAAPKTADAAPKPPIETGSIEPPKATPPAKPQVGVLLATGPSVDSLRLSWTIVNDRSGDAVRGLQPRYVASGKGEERTYGLLAGPLQSTDDAKALCKTMADRGMACEVSVYKGTAF